MYLAILSVLGVSLVAPVIQRWARGAAGWLLALLPLGFFIYFASLIGRVAGGEAIHIVSPWAPSLGVNLTFYIDGLGLLMALLVSGIGALVVIYAGSYLAGDAQIGRFYTLILLFMGSMLGVVLADNAILIFVFWELTSITSYLLIGYKHEKEDSRASALQALLVTGSGGLALLAGMILLGQMGGSLELSVLRETGSPLYQHALYLPALLLILLGAFTKSAQFPFHFWLPNAMAAPTPVSTYLHSATMVKAGIYLLARLKPLLDDAGQGNIWFYSLAIVGSITALLGAWLAWQHVDLKRILAYSTISSLGTLTLLLGFGTDISVKAAVLFLLVHALYKGALFMAAGSIEHETGTRDVTMLGGLGRLMPLTLAAVFLAVLSMSGFPPMLAFISKELLYEVTLEADVWSAGLTAVTAIVNVLLIVAAGVVLILPFFGPLPSPERSPAAAARPIHEAPLAMWLGPLLLSAVALLFGLFPGLLSSAIVAPAASSVANRPVTVSLALWHGINPMFILSLITIVAGAVLYVAHRPLRPRAQGLDTVLARFGPAQWYNWGLDGVLRFAEMQTRLLQNGYLRYYVLYIMITAVGLVGFSLLGRGWEIVWPPLMLDVAIHEVGIAIIILAAALMTVRVESRLSAVAGLGAVGYGIALLYVFFGAPDLAITQLSVETLIVILFVLVIYRLPLFSRLTSPLQRTRDVFVSFMVGALMTVLVLAATAVQRESHLTAYFAENSVELAQGRNIVNVILVDFRSLDTLVEITVLTVASIGVYALLKLRPKPIRPAEEAAPVNQETQTAVSNRESL
jgi:multicomponent Na+:H+ antiporter subunit A